MAHLPTLSLTATPGRRNFVRLLARLSTICLPLLAASPGEAQPVPPKPVLTLQFAVKTPGLATSHAWSANGSLIAILFPFDASIYFFDVANGELIGPIVQHKSSTQLALNPDASLLATTAGKEIRLYATTPFKFLTNTILPHSCGFPYDGPNIVFTDDAAYLWVRCQQTPGLASLVAAVLYSLPNLDAQITIASKSEGSIQSVGGRAVLMGFTTEVIATEQGTDRRTLRYSFECIRLDLRLPCFRSVPLRNTRLERPRRTALSRSFSLLAVGSHTTSLGESRVDFYDTSVGTFLSSINVGASSFLGSFQELAAIDDSYFIGAFNAAKLPNSEVVRDGGVVVWKRETGEILQDIRRGPVKMMSLSPEGRKLLVITQREILMYKIDI